MNFSHFLFPTAKGAHCGHLSLTADLSPALAVFPLLATNPSTVTHPLLPSSIPWFADQDSVAVPALEVFQDRLDEAWSNLV